MIGAPIKKVIEGYLTFLKYAFPKLKAEVQILQAFPLKIVP